MSVAIPGLSGLGTPEVLIIILIVVLLFGAKKLPELARGSGRAIRIFKAETKGLMDDDDDDDVEKSAITPPQQIAPAQPVVPQHPVAQPQATEQAHPAPPAQPLPPTHTEN